MNVFPPPDNELGQTQLSRLLGDIWQALFLRAIEWNVQVQNPIRYAGYAQCKPDFTILSLNLEDCLLRLSSPAVYLGYQRHAEN